MGLYSRNQLEAQAVEDCSHRGAEAVVPVPRRTGEVGEKGLQLQRPPGAHKVAWGSCDPDLPPGAGPAYLHHARVRDRCTEAIRKV